MTPIRAGARPRPARPTRTTRTVGRRLWRVAIVAAALTLTVPAVADAQQPPDSAPDAALEQRIDADQSLVTGPATLARGHVDVGPRFVDGAWTLLAHDDTVVPSVWRRLEETVLRVGDAARQTVPDDPTYDFLGVEPGTDVCAPRRGRCADGVSARPSTLRHRAVAGRSPWPATVARCAKP
jgi:hypothetical protein